MAISQLEQAMATLRLGLAEMRAKEDHMDALVNQFRTQLRRLPRQVVYGQTSLESSLTAMVDSGGAAMLTLKESAVEPSWGALATSEAWVLEEQVLRPELGDATLDHLDFMHDHEEAVAQAESGELQMVFLLKPFPLDAFESIVGGGQRLPRKSTFFFPKLPTGLVINRLDGEL